jgi:hypothetical protein
MPPKPYEDTFDSDHAHLYQTGSPRHEFDFARHREDFARYREAFARHREAKRKPEESNKILSLENQIQGLNTHIEALRQAATKQNLDQRIMELEEEMQFFNKRITELEAEKDRWEIEHVNLNRKAIELENENIAWVTQCDSLLARVKGLGLDKRDLEEQKQALEGEKATWAQTEAHLVQAKEHWENLHTELSAEHNGCAGKINELNAKIENMVEKSELDHRDCAELKEHMECHETNSEEICLRNINDLVPKDRFEAQEREIAQMQSTMVAKVEYDRLKQQLEQLQKQQAGRPPLSPPTFMQSQTPSAYKRISIASITNTSDTSIGLNEMNLGFEPANPTISRFQQLPYQLSSLDRTTSIRGSPSPHGQSPFQPPGYVPPYHRIAPRTDQRQEPPQVASQEGGEMELQQERHQLGFQSAGQPQRLGFQPPAAAGQMGPRLYSFLVEGSLSQGNRTLAVAPELLVMMNTQIAKWKSGRNRTWNWKAHTSDSEKICVETRRQKRTSLKPPARAVACRRCIRSKQLCVLVGKDVGPVIVPLPAWGRPQGATPMNVEYYVNIPDLRATD